MADFGYSQLADYVKCPFRYFLLRIAKEQRVPRDNRGAYIGWVLGWLVELFYAQHWYREPDVVEARMLSALPHLGSLVTKREQILWAPGEETKWLQKAAEAVPKILATIRRERLLGTFVAHEYDVYIALGGDRIFGRIDLLIILGDVMLVLDMKAGGTVGRWVSANQIRLYVAGVLSDPRFRRLPTRAGFWWLRHDKITWRQFSAKTLKTFVAGTEATLAAVRAKQFEPKPSEYCRLCEFLPRCAAGQERQYRTPAVEGLPLDRNAGEISL